MKYGKVENLSREEMKALLKENLFLRAGYNDGRKTQATKMLRIVLQEKFGELPEWVLTYVQTAKLAELEKAVTRVWNAVTVEEVLYPSERTEVKKKPKAKGKSR